MARPVGGQPWALASLGLVALAGAVLLGGHIADPAQCQIQTLTSEERIRNDVAEAHRLAAIASAAVTVNRELLARLTEQQRSKPAAATVFVTRVERALEAANAAPENKPGVLNEQLGEGKP